ncbi:MAG: hypothetical protein ACJA17_000137 [Polaribacter sp.]
MDAIKNKVLENFHLMLANTFSSKLRSTNVSEQLVSTQEILKKNLEK